MAGAVLTENGIVKEHAETKSRPIDLVYLARQTLGDPGLETEILTLFSQMARSYFDKVAKSGDIEEVRIGLHALKGAAAGVGAGAMVTQAAAAEAELLETGKLSTECLSDLAMAVEEVQAFISGLQADK